MAADTASELDPVFRCLGCGADCSADGEDYMLNDEVWAATGLRPYDGFLCIGCLEKRLGRRLRSEDFRPTATDLQRKYWRYDRMYPKGRPPETIADVIAKRVCCRICGAKATVFAGPFGTSATQTIYGTPFCDEHKPETRRQVIDGGPS